LAEARDAFELDDLGKPRDREREKAALKRLLAYVEAARRDVHPILDDAVSVHEYEPGTWGPRRRNKKVPRGDIWPDPEPPDAG
jgi:hypothetical protein